MGETLCVLQGRLMQGVGVEYLPMEALESDVPIFNPSLSLSF